MRVEILIRIPFLDRRMSSGIRSSTGTTFAGSRDNLNLRLKGKVKQSIILINNTFDSTRREIEACLRPLCQKPFPLVLSHRNFVLPGTKRFYQSVWSWLEVPDSKLHSHLIKDSWTSNGDKKEFGQSMSPSIVLTRLDLHATSRPLISLKESEASFIEEMWTKRASMRSHATERTTK